MSLSQKRVMAALASAALMLPASLLVPYPARADSTTPGAPAASPTTGATPSGAATGVPSPTPTTNPGGTPTTSSATPPSTGISWDLPSTTSIAGGRALTAHGTTSIANAAVQLVSGSSVIATAAARSDGTFQFPIPTSTVGTATYHAAVLDSDALTPDATVTVDPALTWNISGSRTVEALSPLTGTGKVYATPVPSSLQLIHGGRVTTTIPVAADGTFRIALPTNHPGRTYFYVRSTNPPLAGNLITVTTVVHLNLRSRPASGSDVRYSYRSGCPVGPSQLRVYSFRFLDWTGNVEIGTLIARNTQTAVVSDVFGSALSAGYRFRRIRTADAFHGYDPAMMADDDTSAFNCRRVTGNPYALSPHSYGTAYDLNTVENPYRDATGRWWPSSFGQQYRGRATARMGMLYLYSAATKAFLRHGVGWGAGWAQPDYQHFDPTAPHGGYSAYQRAPRYDASAVR